MTNKQAHPISIGKNIERVRKVKYIKQDVLANALGVTRQYISKLEQKDEIKEETLEQIAKALGVTAETIRSYNEDAAFSYIKNNYDSASSSFNGHSISNFNPLDKLMEMVEQNRALYERLIQTEREKNALLESILNKEK
jgi:transcriptional regulator with XRE-family HTH domain